MQEMWVLSMVPEDPLEEETATHSSILGWRISWTEETAGLQSMGPERAGQRLSVHRHTHTCLTDNAVLVSGVVCIC